MEPLLTSLVELVRKYYENWEEPLFLSRLGQKLGDGRKELVERYGRLANAVVAVGPSQLDIVGQDLRGQAAVVTPEVREAVTKMLGQGGSAGGTAFDNLPLPLRVAFCLRTEADERVAVHTSSPVRYQKFGAEDHIPNDFVTIEDRYREPGLQLGKASAPDKERLWRAFLSWAEKHGLDPNLLTRRLAPTNALERLLAAQPSDVVARMSLPADIVSILLRHS